MIFQFDTTSDEDAAMQIGLAITNGGLATKNEPQVDMQGYFTLWVREKLTPLAQQALMNRAQPLLTAFMKADETGKQQLLASVAKG